MLSQMDTIALYRISGFLVRACNRKSLVRVMEDIPTGSIFRTD